MPHSGHAPAHLVRCFAEADKNHRTPMPLMLRRTGARRQSECRTGDWVWVIDYSLIPPGPHPAAAKDRLLFSTSGSKVIRISGSKLLLSRHNISISSRASDYFSRESRRTDRRGPTATSREIARALDAPRLRIRLSELVRSGTAPCGPQLGRRSKGGTSRIRVRRRDKLPGSSAGQHRASAGS